ncbi:hypothetical protein [Streptomyces similanensis]|uniref:Serine peptidase n=1 Tax=Streptomyces similanensis TaxID=1274988 RepID=A0ABP9L504_9ACTN
MSRVVLVHGIAQETKGEESLLLDWYPALCDGLKRAEAEPVDRAEVSMAFWGHVFRPAGRRTLGPPVLDASDVEQGLEEELLLGWWEAASAAETRVPGPEEPARLRTPRPVQRALDALSHSAFFAGLGESLLIHAARQVRRYFTEPAVRAGVQAEFARCVTDRTELVIAHSLGSVIAYEGLCAHPEWPDLTLITLGSPLGVRKMVFDRLEPAPAGGFARWPAPVRKWTNIADSGDAVALAKELAPAFGARVTDVPVHNGARAHDVRPYLTARETGAAVTRSLRRPGASA